MEYRETFLQIQMRLHQHHIPKNCINGIRQSKSRSIRRQHSQKISEWVGNNMCPDSTACTRGSSEKGCETENGSYLWQRRSCLWMQRLKNISTISSVNRSTGTPTICSSTRSDTRSCNITITTSTIYSWICGCAIAKIRCTMHTCQTLQHKLPRTAMKRKVMDNNNNTSDGTRRNFRRIGVIVRHVSNREQKESAHIHRVQMNSMPAPCSVRRFAGLVHPQ